jgi:hypothetical protein
MAGLGREKGNILKVINFCSPGETFRVLKEKEEKQYGEYRTRRLVLETLDRLCKR